MCANNVTLNILSWNAQSISNESKATELKLLLSEYDVHIACIQETYLTSNIKTFVQNYHIYRNDRPTHGGGVAILVRSNISHKLLKLHDTTTIENISIEITAGSRKLIIVSAYNPHFSTHFASDIEIIANNDSEIAIFGDMNAKHPAWNCSKPNSAGKILHNFINSSDFTLISPDEATHHPHSGATPSTIDLLITNSSIPIENLCTLDKHISDHSPILCQLCTSTREAPTRSFNYRTADWDKYRNLIEEHVDLSGHLNSRAEIDASIELFTEMILNARDSSVPKRPFRERLFQIARDTLSAIRY